MPCSGGHPEWHIQGDVLEQLDKGWDLMIAHPPCTYLSNAGSLHLFKGKKLNQERYLKGLEAKEFFMKLLNAPIAKICVENPIQATIFKIPKYTQIIQPYMFGDEASKKTCLWLKGLPNLQPTKIVGTGEWVYFKSKDGKQKRLQKWYHEALTKSKSAEERRTLRSKTFLGIAKAMAEQWGKQ